MARAGRFQSSPRLAPWDPHKPPLAELFQAGQSGPDVHKMRILLVSRLLVPPAPTVADHLSECHRLGRDLTLASGRQGRGGSTSRPASDASPQPSRSAVCDRHSGRVPTAVRGTGVTKDPEIAAAVASGIGGDALRVHHVRAPLVGVGGNE